MPVKKLIEKIPDILLAQVAGFSLVYGLTSSLCLTYPPIKILLLVMLCIIVLYAFFYNKKTTLASTILLGIAFIAGTMYIVFRIGIQKVIAFLDDYFYWLVDFIKYPGNPYPLYQFITVTALCILISVFSYIFILKKFMFLFILGAGMGLFTIQWSYNIASSLIPFYIFLPVTLIVYLKYVYIKKASKEPNEYAKSSIMVIWGLPVCIIIAAFSYSIHASDKPIEWKWLDKKIESVFNYFNDRFDYEVYDYFSLSASSGFGDKNNILGGRVKLDRTNVLDVTTNKNVYLKGVTKEIYTGTSWINSPLGKYSLETDYQDVLYNDTEEMLHGMSLLTGNENFIEDYFDSNEVSVTFMNLKTKSVFIPSKATSFKTNIDNFNSIIKNSGDISASKRLTKGFSYTLDMYSPKIGSEEFANVIRKSKEGLYEEHLRNTTLNILSTPEITLVPANNSLDQLKIDLTKLSKRSIQIYREYLQLPINLPQRVKDLSSSLVVSATNNYDKAKAIEQFLSSNYPYNLDVRSTPRNRDFVDYFLFDLKEGYCSYYASAMTILARCAGLPARYVEGFILPPEPVENSNTDYIVTNMQAHAWVEIYFEGYGWLPFEPTAPFRSNFYSSDDSDVVYSGNYSSSYDEYMEMMRRYGNEDDSDFDFNGVVTQDNTSSLFDIIIIPEIIALLFIILFLFNLFRNRLKLYKLINLPAKECILHLYYYYISVLNMQKLGYKTAETPFQYSDRIDSLMFFSPVKFRVITDIFVKSRYSLREVTENEKQLLCDFHTCFFEEVKVNMGKFRYFLFKYILGKI